MKAEVYEVQTPPVSNSSDNIIAKNDSNLGGVHRRLEGRHVQLISIGGIIGTGLLGTIGTGLIRCGALGIFLVYTFWTFIVMLLTSAVCEFICYLPVSSPFISMAGVLMRPYNFMLV